MLTRRTLLSTGLIKPSRIVKAANVSRMTKHAIILAKLYDEFIENKDISSLTYIQQKYAVRLLQAYELAVEQIEDIDMREEMSALIVNPFYVKYTYD